MKILIVIKLIPKFLKLCLKFPLTIRENFNDVKSMYHFRTDKELIDIDEQLNKL